MATASVTTVVEGLGMRMDGFVRREADGGDVANPTLPAGKSGTLTTHTSATVGVVTLPSGHGFTTSDIVDVRYVGGPRYACTITAVTGTTITLGAGGLTFGEDLPVVSTAVLVSKQIVVDPLVLDEADLALLAFQVAYAANVDESAESRVTFVDGSDNEFQYFLQANQIKTYDVAWGEDSPATQGDGGQLVKARASNGSATNDATLKILWIKDLTP